MASVGIVRNVDPVGRIVIPREMRKILDINIGAPLSISVVNNEVIIRKYKKGCIFCGSEEELIEYNDACVCKKCRNLLNK